jgi:hypothetical protein
MMASDMALPRGVSRLRSASGVVVRAARPESSRMQLGTLRW